MTSIPLTLSLAPLPTGTALSADEFGQQLIANISAVLNGNLLLGQSFGTAPPTNIGPWFNGTTWFIWNDTLGAYAPIPSQSPFSTVHNGQMQVWQRGTSFTNVSGSSYTADRYLANETLVTGIATVSRSALNLLATSTYPDTEYGLRITVTTDQATVSANEYFQIDQKLERINARALFDNPTSFSLVLQSSAPGTYCVSIRDAGADWSYVMECVVTASGVPQAFTFPSIPAFPTATGNWGTADTDACYIISVSATCGATFQTPANIWSAGNFIASSNQSNLFDTIGNTLDITLIQHEPGLMCNPFIFTPFDEDLSKCQRYYTKSFNYGTNPNEFSLVTSLATDSGSVLTFASTTGAITNSTVAIGMPVFGTNITSGTTTVSIVTPTTVTLSAPVVGTVALGASITFSNPASVINEVSTIVVNTTQSWGNIRFPVKMRTTPTIASWSVLYGQLGAVFSGAQGANIGGITFPSLGDMGFNFVTTSSAWSTAPNVIRLQYTSSADL